MRDLTYRITADHAQALRAHQQVDAAIAKTTAQTQQITKAQGGLVDAYGRAVTPTKQFADAQDTVNKKKKEGFDLTEKLSSSIVRYASAAVVLAAVDSTVKYVSNLDKLATALNTTAKGVQQWENIAISTNTTVDDLTQAFFQMEVRLSSGDKGAVKALRDLRINMSEFLQLPAEQRLFALNAAFKTIDSTVEQNRIGTELFGKNWRGVMKAVTGDVEQFADSVGLMSDETVQSLANAETGWQRLWTTIKRGFGETLALLGEGATMPFAATGALAGVLGSRAAGKDWGAWEALPTAPGRPGLPDRGPTAPTMPGADQLAADAAAMLRATQQRTMFTGLQNQDSAINLRYSPSAWQAWMATQGKGFQEGPLGVFDPSMFPAAGEGFGSNSMLFGRTIGSGMGVGPASLAGTSAVPGRGFFGRTGITGDALTSIGMMAATGGGNLGQAAGGLLAGGATTALMTNSAGQMMGGAIGSLIPGLGTILGTLAGGALGKLFGPSEESSKVNKPRQAFFQKFGGLEGLNPMLQQATGGVGLAQDLLSAKTEEASTAAMAAITDALDTYIQKLETAGAALEAVTVKTLQVTSVTPAMQAAIDAAMSATNIDAYNASMAELNGLLDTQLQEQQLLDETMKKYGLTWKDLGKDAKDARVAEITKGIVKEFDVLSKAGVDVNTIMRQMGPSVNDFVKEAKKSGAEVPESFRRIIQTAIDAGEIFDENKHKVSDITSLGLTFGTTMEDVQRDIADSMRELAKVLKETLGGAFVDVKDKARAEFAKIPRDIDVDVNYHSDGYSHPDESHSGSMIRAWGLERFHSGGLLDDERLLIGQVGEGILSRRGVRALGGASAVHALNRGEAPGGGVTIGSLTIHAGATTDPRRLARQVLEELDYELRGRRKMSVR